MLEVSCVAFLVGVELQYSVSSDSCESADRTCSRELIAEAGMSVPTILLPPFSLMRTT